MNLQVKQDTNYMINYIQNSLKLIKNTNSLIDFVKINDINYSENNNGLFINLSLLSENKIKIFYDLIYYLANNENNTEYIKEDNIKNNSEDTTGYSMEDTVEETIETTTEDTPVENLRKLKLSQFQSKLLMYSK